MCYMGRWSEEKVAGAAPDGSSLAAARKLARPGPWSGTGSNDVLVWGKCQGSGKTPYQISVDIAAPAYRCSCPSRKFPCKHALALLLLWARGETADAGTDTADFAEEWATQRADRAAARERRQTDQQADPVAQAKRLADRLSLMDAGIADFARWLTDLVRTGLAAAHNQPYSWWDGVAGRLVDAQLPGLAEQVRAMGSDVHARADWADHLLLRTGRWWALTKAWGKRDELSPTELADLRAAVGWATASAEVQSTEALPGPWLVLGAHRSDDGRLRQQRTWLRGPDGTVVVVLDFAAQGEALAIPQLAGALLDAPVARYPGSAPQRAMFTGPIAPQGLADSLGEGVTIALALEMESAAVALSPWRDLHPVVFAGVRVCPGGHGWLLDSSGDALPLANAPVDSLLALTGSHPVHVFGLGRVIPEHSRETARAVVRQVSGELEDRLRAKTVQAVSGGLNRAARTRRPRHRDIDWNRTIAANLKNYQPDYRTVVPERLVGYARRSTEVQREIILCIDQSGSMAESVVYSSVFGAVLSSLRSVRTRLVVFDTEVVDLTEDMDDPVDVLFGVQLGGGTDINRALAYCQEQITRPAETILVLISDLYEGGVAEEMLRRAAAIVGSGATLIALLALSDSGHPTFDSNHAAVLAGIGVPAFACTPDLFPELMAAAIERRDVTEWAASHDIATNHES